MSQPKSVVPAPMMIDGKRGMPGHMPVASATTSRAIALLCFHGDLRCLRCELFQSPFLG
ncbi:MAG: hypothetical protein ACI8Z5_001151 [Lentimonas sp.]|jgi:hypothetical protein